MVTAKLTFKRQAALYLFQNHSLYHTVILQIHYVSTKRYLQTGYKNEETDWDLNNLHIFLYKEIDNKGWWVALGIKVVKLQLYKI